MKKLERSYIRQILDAINERTISFAGGLPNENLFPVKDLKVATNKVLENPLCLQYSKSQGVEGLREKIADIYTNKFDFPTNKDEILITTGSQQAFDIIAKTFLDKELYVQKPTYIGALSAYKVLDMDIKSFDDLDDLENKLNSTNGFYAMSDFTNPTGRVIDQKRREDVAKILNKKECYFIEDGAYSLIDFNGVIRKPISALYEKSFHMGSFSKIVAPGFRVGWIRAKKEYIDQMMVSKEAVDLHTSTFNQMILDEYMNEFDLFEHIKLVRKEYKSKMEYMAECFEKYIPSFEFKRPQGGMFIYGSFKEDSFELAKKALEVDVAFVPAKVFFHNNQDSNEARFNFTNSTFEQIEQGIIRLAKLLSPNNEIKKECIA
ncbi:aminotransferase-like domain-containing protein [Halarcobacter anaerophilus]|uniref:Aminotransferase class I n=1 Tax=Halarcobacter anaerophilus TaxID=877500 RepID=A0A4Q0Y3E3_9BACT|nr:PLP-dependent aminotransferase family protein [Halarcobacter anaerophilus]QDF29432.1 PLP-dependent aminotransferase [Halarcobacter anaerophilus]RXJ64676.1 aminotransferase class I [Halarcobacter anaerophilus]